MKEVCPQQEYVYSEARSSYTILLRPPWYLEICPFHPTIYWLLLAVLVGRAAIKASCKHLHALCRRHVVPWAMLLTAPRESGWQSKPFAYELLIIVYPTNVKQVMKHNETHYFNTFMVPKIKTLGCICLTLHTGKPCFKSIRSDTTSRTNEEIRLP